MNTDFLIDDFDLNDAQAKCAHFLDTDVRNKAIASFVAVKVAERFFAETKCEVEAQISLHGIENIVSKYDISDIYVNGNYVDVRLYFNEDEICVPALHFKKEMLPLAYMFVKVQKDLGSATVTGFMLPDTITVVDENSKYYPVNENALVPFEEIEYMFHDAEDLYNVDDIEIYSVLDGTMQDTTAFVKKLIYSVDGRRRFIRALIAHLVLNGMEIKPENDNVNQSEEIISEDTQVYEDKQETPSQNEDVEEHDSYDFSTVVSPNLPEEILEDIPEETRDEYGELERDLDNMDVAAEDEKLEEAEAEIPAEEIETLFEGEKKQEGVSKTVTKRGSVLPLLLLLLILLVGGYFGYTKFVQTNDVTPNELPEQQTVEQNNETVEKNVSDAMPVETVEKAKESVSKNEGNSVSIPAIEQNLDASILVSNLRIDWEVPSGYVANTQAKRYLVKLGKIIQLNLKAELLLLNKPPITNKITVELKFNSTSKCFETVGIVASSGESSVDNIILQTVNQALRTKLNISTDSFEKISGNPVLVIKL